MYMDKKSGDNYHMQRRVQGKLLIAVYRRDYIVILIDVIQTAVSYLQPSIGVIDDTIIIRSPEYLALEGSHIRSHLD
jgi:hypothetical protein